MTPTEKLQAEAEQLYPYTDKLIYAEWRTDEVIDRERAAHLACAEKYTAIIDQLKQKHEERILILALDMQKKDQEIERLRELAACQNAYINLLGDEISELVGLAHVHGWKSSRADAGTVFRKRIEELSKTTP